MLRAKQVQKFIAAPIKINGVSAIGGTTNVTSQITSALSSAGDGGVSVPLQVSSNGGLGVAVISPDNKVDVWDNVTKKKLGGSDEVYARLTFSSANYTLSFYQLINGVETSYVFGQTTAIDFEFIYVFDFARVPSTFALSRNTYTDSVIGGVTTSDRVVSEVLSISTLNTVPQLSKTPSRSNSVFLIVNNAIYSATTGELTVSGKTLTWVKGANNNFDLETTDLVVAMYSTTE